MTSHALHRVVQGLVAFGGSFAISSGAMAGYAKRGFGSGDAGRIDAVNSTWYYNWGLGRSTSGAEFVPMFWSGWAATDANVLAVRNDASVTTVLGFNEPERADQANMSVTAALDAWPKLQATGKRLVSPAPSDTIEGRAWLQSFMTGAAARGYQVDAVAFHWYGDVRQPGAASSFLNAVAWYHTTFNKPVWITEFAGMDWWNDPSKPVTMAMNLAFMQQVLPQLDSRSYVERYAWWNWSDVSNLVVDPSPLTTTSLGDYWTGTTYATGQTFDLRAKDTGNDIYYLRGGTVTDTAPTGTDVMRRLDVVSGTGTITGAGRWELADGLLRVRSASTLRKLGSNVVALKHIAAINDGLISITEGTLQFEDGSIGSGAGTFRVESGGTLAFANRTSSATNAITNAIELHGGTLRGVNGSQVVSSALSVTSPSILNVVGQLDLTGTLSGSAAVTKTGAGILRITSRAPSTISSPITVSEGTLYLDKPGSSVTGTSSIAVLTNGTLAGAALVMGNATVAGHLTPGTPGTASTAEIRFASALSLSSSATTEIDLVSSGAADRITGQRAVTLDGQLELRPVGTFDPAYLEPITVISGSSVIGQFDSVAGMILSATKSLAVTYTSTGVCVTAALPGDATLDGKVSFDDLLTLARNYQATNRSWAEGDFNGDSLTSFADLLTLAKQYAGPRDAVSVPLRLQPDWALATSLLPEPTLACGSLATLFICKRRRTVGRPSQSRTAPF